MITQLLVGIAFAIVVSSIPKFVKLRHLVLHVDVGQEVYRWAKLELRSFKWIAGIIAVVMIIDIAGALRARALWGGGDYDAGASLAIALTWVEIAVLVIGLTVAAVFGSKASKIKQSNNIQSPVSVHLGLRVLLFIAGWVTYFVLLQFFLKVVGGP